jgi:hypothetical protein
VQEAVIPPRFVEDKFAREEDSMRILMSQLEA